MHKTQYRKQRDKPERLVTDEAEREREESPEVERLAAERIDQEAGEGPAGERTDGVERNDDARGRVVGLELLDDEHREDGQQLVKAEEQQKVRRRARREVPCPESWFCGSIRHIKYPGAQR